MLEQARLHRTRACLVAMREPLGLFEGGKMASLARRRVKENGKRTSVILIWRDDRREPQPRVSDVSGSVPWIVNARRIRKARCMRHPADRAVVAISTGVQGWPGVAQTTTSVEIVARDTTVNYSRGLRRGRGGNKSRAARLVFGVQRSGARTESAGGNRIPSFDRVRTSSGVQGPKSGASAALRGPGRKSDRKRSSGPPN